MGVVEVIISQIYSLHVSMSLQYFNNVFKIKW
jgi:hypothetical protein